MRRVIGMTEENLDGGITQESSKTVETGTGDTNLTERGRVAWRQDGVT